MKHTGALRALVGAALAVTVALAGSSVTPAVAAVAPVTQIAPTVPLRGEAFVVTAVLGTRVARPVQLQRWSAGRWVGVSRGVTSRSGVARFTHRTTAVRMVLRVSAPRYRARGRTWAARVSRARTVVTGVQSVALTVSRDGGSRVDAVVTASHARSGRWVALQAQRPGEPWQSVASSRMGAARTISLPDVMTADRARGLRLRAYLGGYAGAPAVASVEHEPPRVELQWSSEADQVRLTATTTGLVQKVRFFVDGTLLTEDTSAPWQATWPTRAGTHDVMARAYGPLESVLTPTQQVVAPAATIGVDSGLAEGFSLETVQSGFELPTSAAPTSTGLVFVSEKAGLVKVLTPEEESGWSLPRDALDLRDQVLDEHDAGLIGVATDPHFADNGFVYLSYTLDDGHPDDPRQAQQVARYHWDGTELDASSRHVVLGSVTGPDCHGEDNLRTPDCVPLIGRAHTIGDLAFDDAGHLLVGMGDGSLYATSAGLGDRYEAIRAQDPEILAGKILRIDPTTGHGVPENPLYTGDGSSNASRVLATGLRNPFRFTARGDRLIAGDVGESTYEELNVVPLTGQRDAPPNYGWPCLEGEVQTSLPGVEDADSPWHPCVAVRSGGATEAPALTYRHSTGGGSVTAGAFLDSEAYPPSVRGHYLYGDYAQNFMRTAQVSHDGEVSEIAVLANATAADGPVKFFTGPDGLVWALSIYSGSVRRVRYTGEGVAERCPPGRFRRTFHDLDGPDSVFDQEFPDNEYRWLFPYAAAQLPTEALAAATCEPGIHLDPTTGSPWATDEHPDVRAHPGDRFGTAWRGRVDLDAGTYRFTVSGTEWVRLWVDDEPVHDFYASDFWSLESVRQHDVVLTAGQHHLRAEHVHGDQSNAFADVTWQRVGGPPAITVEAPANGVVATAGQVPWSVAVSDPDDDSATALQEKVVLSVDFLHYDGGSYHAHPVQHVTGQLSGTVPVDDVHAPGVGVVRLRATATDATGARTTSAPVYVCLPNGAVGPCQD